MEFAYDSLRVTAIFQSSIQKMPIPSRLLPTEGYSGLDVVPYNYDGYATLPKYLLENSTLTMTLCEHHLHCTSVSEGLYSLDFQLVTSLWFILKDISRTIQLTANPLFDPFNSLPSTVDPELLEHIDMRSPAILAVKKYTQNLLTITSIRAELCRLFGLAQQIRLYGAQWVQTAQEKCKMSHEGFGCNWSENGNALAYSVTMPKSVCCGYIESTVDDDELDYSKALILYPTLSTYVQEHPDFDPFFYT